MKNWPTRPTSVSAFAPFAYKEVEAVIEAVEGAGIARAVARLEPLAVIKG